MPARPIARSATSFLTACQLSVPVFRVLASSTKPTKQGLVRLTACRRDFGIFSRRQIHFRAARKENATSPQVVARLPVYTQCVPTAAALQLTGASLFSFETSESYFTSLSHISFDGTSYGCAGNRQHSFARPCHCRSSAWRAVAADAEPPCSSHALV